MTLKPGALLALALIAWGSGAAAAEPVKADAALQKRLGVVTAPLVAARQQSAVTGFARVLDPAPLAQLDADLSAALAAASASRAQAARARSLNAADAAVSAKAAEAAEATARADASRVTLLRRRLGLEWGPSFLRLSDTARGRMLAEIAAGRLALVRIDMAGGAPLSARSARIDLGQGRFATATVLGPARQSDPRIQSVGLIASVSGPMAAALPVGLSAPATVAEGSGATGVILPRSALLRLGGQTQVYVRTAEGFDLRPAQGGVSGPAGLFVTRGFSPGEVVAVQGASALHAAQTPVEEAD